MYKHKFIFSLVKLQTSSKCMVSAGADGHIRVWDKILPMYALADNDDQIKMEVVDQTQKQ